VTVPLAELIILELEQDEIQFTHPIYQKVLAEFTQHLNAGNIPDLNYFTNYPDQEVSQLAVDLVQIPYTLSNWEKHFIHVQTESMTLKKTALHSIYALKLRRLELMIQETQKKLGDAKGEEDTLLILQEQQALIEAKRMFSKLLGRVVLK
jgi:DNA primase